MFSDPLKNLTKLGVQHGMTVADLGAGSGFYSLAAARLVSNGGKVYAIEVQKDILERIKNAARTERLTSVEVVWGDIENIGGTKLRDLSVDRAIVSNVLFQIEKKDNLCLEVKRILKKGGKVLVVDWSEVSPLGPKTVVSRMHATALFEKAGFVYESDVPAGDHHYGLIFKKP